MKMMSQQIRDAVNGSTMSRYRIAILSGVDHGQFSRFMAAKRGLGQGALDRLVAVLNMELVSRKG